MPSPDVQKVIQSLVDRWLASPSDDPGLARRFAPVVRCLCTWAGAAPSSFDLMARSSLSMTVQVMSHRSRPIPAGGLRRLSWELRSIQR